jgi:hypothetical protein
MIAFLEQMAANREIRALMWCEEGEVRKWEAFQGSDFHCHK